MGTFTKYSTMPRAKTTFVRKIRLALALMIVAGVVGVSVVFHYGRLSAGSAFSAVFADGGVRVDRSRSYGPHARHMLDIYRPADGAETGPIAVFFYGGGWRDGERATYGFVGQHLPRAASPRLFQTTGSFPK